MDMKVLQQCVRANVGDLTFEACGKCLYKDELNNSRSSKYNIQEAYARTKRVLNISVSSSRKQEVPQLLNYLTAPNVVCSFLSAPMIPLSIC